MDKKKKIHYILTTLFTNVGCLASRVARTPTRPPVTPDRPSRPPDKEIFEYI
jgi:hypothetical protein